MEKAEQYIKEDNDVVILDEKNLTKSHINVKRKELAKYMDRDFIREKLDLIDNPQDRMLCTFLWMTGCRITEALSIRKQDIDLINKTIRVRWLKSRKYEERNFPMHPTIRQVLYAYTAGLKYDEKMFKFSRQRAWQITKKWFNCSPHQFRHSFAVHYLRSDGELINLHRLLGHSNIQTTMEYLKIVPKDLSKELDAIQF